MTAGPARFDAVVVGAGPAGSVAATVLARGGARVALLDKAAFPRDKACGDLVGPRGARVLADLGISLPQAGRGADLLAVGPSGRRSRLPAFEGRDYPGYGLVLPRLRFDHALRQAAVAAGATALRARVASAEIDSRGRARAVVAADGRRFEAEVVIGADGALSPTARLAGLMGRGEELWGFAIRAYLPAEVGLPLLALLDEAPWRIYPGYGWLFPGVDGQANVGIGIGLGGRRGPAPLRGDLDRFCALLRERGDLPPGAAPGPVVGGWLRMGGGTPLASANVLLVGDAAGLVNPLQGEGIGPAMVSGVLAARAVLAEAGAAGGGYTEAMRGSFGRYLRGAAALQRSLLRHPRLTSAAVRALTAPVIRGAVAGTWSVYWNGLADGACPRPAAWAAAGVQRLAGALDGR